MNAYPNLRMLQIIEGERGGVPILPPAGADWQGAPPAGSAIDDLKRRTQDWLGQFDRWGRRKTPGQPSQPKIAEPQMPSGLPEAENCVLPGLFGGCLITQETFQFLMINGLLVAGLIVGLVMLAQPAIRSVGGAVGKVVDVVT